MDASTLATSSMSLLSSVVSKPYSAVMGSRYGEPTRSHWEGDHNRTVCAETGCANLLSFGNRHHCRYCGKLFCGECVGGGLQRRLNIKAQFAERGVFSPVCYSCYIIDNGWFSDRDTAAFKEAASGHTRDRMTDFASERRLAIEESKRVQKVKKESTMTLAWKEEIARQMAVATAEANTSSGSLGASRRFRNSEQLTKTRQHWINERTIQSCQNLACRLPFSLNERKHHCRICGRVFCDGCSPKRLDLTLFLPDDVSIGPAEEGGGSRLSFGPEEDGARGLERCCGECYKDLGEFRALKDMRNKLEGAGTHVLCNLYAPVPGYAKGIDAALDKLRRATLYLDRITELAAGPDAVELTEMAVADVHVIKGEVAELFRRYEERFSKILKWGLFSPSSPPFPSNPPAFPATPHPLLLPCRYEERFGKILK